MGTGGDSSQSSASSDNNFVLYVDFENRVANSTYTETQLIRDFNANRDDGGIAGPNAGNTRIIQDPGYTGRGKVLSIRHRAGQFGGGASFKARFAPDNQNKKGSSRFDDVYFAYDIYLSSNTVFMPAHKLPGLMTGTLLEASHSGDKVTGIKPEGIVAFNSRVAIYTSASFPAIPVSKGALINYTYDAQRTRSTDFLNTSDPSEDIDNSLGANVDKLYTIPTGRWVTIEQRVKLNSADSNDIYNPDNDRKDGLAQVWVDGKLMLSRTHLWRWTDTMKADGFWLYDYYNDRPELSSPPPEDQFTYYDNIRVSTSPITHP
jgi:hypothetical protein